MNGLQDVITKMNHRKNITVLRNGWLIPSTKVTGKAIPVQVSNIIGLNVFSQFNACIDFGNAVFWNYNNNKELADDLKRIYDLLFPLDDDLIHKRGEF